MAKIIKQRMTVKMSGDFVVFIIGMRVNRFLKFSKWWPVAQAMTKMVKELKSKNSEETGFFGVEQNFGLIVQYWRSFAHLEAYAKNRDHLHYPAWKAFNTIIKSNGM